MTPAERSNPTRAGRTPAQAAFRAWLLVMAPCALIAGVDALWGLTHKVAAVFFAEQDMAVAAVMTLVLLAFLVLPAPRTGLRPPQASARGLVAALAVTAAILAFCGHYIVLEGYPLSMDEFTAGFGARIYAAGRMVASVPPAWRDYVPVLQPQFVLYAPDHSWWTGGYLPVNAAILALASRVGAEALVGPFWASLAIVATWGAGLKLWPERPGTALWAAVLLATSAQLLFTAMTPYAMSAHLALDMAWLWLFLRGRWLGHLGAVAVGFLAAGLHQLVFHPLFVAPFVLELWLARRWKSALWYTAAYAAICVFWIEWWSFALPQTVVPAAPGHTHGALQGFFGHVLALVGQLDVRAPLFMAENLVRAFTWQSLLTGPLFVLALWPALKTPGPLRALALGPLLMLGLCLVLLPFQGHGWGYRYLAGFLGSMALLASWSWTRLTASLPFDSQALARAMFAAAAIVSVALLPLRAWQANRFVRPFASAERAIEGSGARVVLVDTLGVWYGFDLVRNDPFFRRGPVVLPLALLSEAQVKALCKGGVTVFGEAQAGQFGIRPDRYPRPVDAERTPALRAALKRDCGAPQP